MLVSSSPGLSLKVSFIYFLTFCTVTVTALMVFHHNSRTISSTMGWFDTKRSTFNRISFNNSICFLSAALGRDSGSGCEKVEMSLQLKVFSINVILPRLMREPAVVEIKICVILPGPRQKIETLELKLIEFESDKVECGELLKLVRKDEYTESAGREESCGRKASHLNGGR